MEKAKKTKIDNDMDEVIESAKKIRAELDQYNDEHQISSKALQVYKAKIDVNKNIVSASIVKVSVEKLK